MAKSKDKYCVIAAALTCGQRKLMVSEKEAAGHARGLLKKEHINRGGRPNKVYVVKIMRVFETGAPIITSRLPNDDDEVVVTESD